MGCFWGCGNRCNNNCNRNCNGNWNNNCDCDDDDDEVDCSEEVRRAYWAGYRAGCNDPRCHRRFDDDDDCGCN